MATPNIAKDTHSSGGMHRISVIPVRKVHSREGKIAEAFEKKQRCVTF